MTRSIRPHGSGNGARERDHRPKRERRNEGERRSEQEERLVHRLRHRLFFHEVLDAVGQRLAPSLDDTVGPEPILNPGRDLPLSERQERAATMYTVKTTRIFTIV